MPPRPALLAVVVTLALLLAGPGALAAAAPPHPEDPDITGRYVGSFLRNGVHIATTPFHLKTSDWLQDTAVLAAAGGLFLLDRDIRRVIQHNRNGTLDKLSNGLEPLGNSLVLVPLLGSGYLVGRMSDSPRLTETSLLGFESWFLTAAVTKGLKLAVHRHRPRNGQGNDAFDGPSFSGGNDSFPSGHATSAFAVASVVASEYHDEPLVPLGAYGLATLVSWSRLNDDEHWASDVFFGSALGYGIGRLVYASDPFLRRHHLQLRPMAGNGATGLNVATRF